MQKEEYSIPKDLQELLEKVSKANSSTIANVVEVLSNIGTSQLKPEDIASVQQKLFTDAANAFVKLNIDYTERFMDIFVVISKNLSDLIRVTKGSKEKETTSNQSDSATSFSSPAFELKTSGPAGGSAETEFLLNSDKIEPINCLIKNSAFVNTTDSSLSFDSVVKFAPQEFKLLPLISLKVRVLIKIPTNVKLGIYKCQITIVGFEHTYFNIILEVTESQASGKNNEKKTVLKTTTNEKSALKKKTKSKKKTTPKK